MNIVFIKNLIHNAKDALETQRIFLSRLLAKANF